MCVSKLLFESELGLQKQNTHMRLRNRSVPSVAEGKDKLFHIRNALKRYKFIPKDESSLRMLSSDEQSALLRNIEAIHSFSEIPDDSKLWSLIWKSYAKTDASFICELKCKSDRLSHLKKRWIHGGSFKCGRYIIVVRNLRHRSIVRHEIQHVIDDADSMNYVKDPIYFERRSVWVENQNEHASKEEIELVYS